MEIVTSKRTIWHDQSGATAIEYALIAALIAVALASSFAALGTSIETHYEEIGTAVQDANTGG